jgi:hypothetical protein
MTKKRRVYPGLSKPTHQRLIAADANMPIPAQFEEILTWLAPPPETKKRRVTALYL